MQAHPQITVTRHLPTGVAEIVEMSLCELLREDADCRMMLTKNKFPSIGELNAVLLRGSGDDGFVPHTWIGFSISLHEYERIRQDQDCGR